MTDTFWETIRTQVLELRSATTADDVLRILSKERNPYGRSDMVDGEGFFGGGGGDDTVMEALREAGWVMLWCEASYHYAMKAPDGTAITYVEGDIYRGTPSGQMPC